MSEGNQGASASEIVQEQAPVDSNELTQEEIALESEADSQADAAADIKSDPNLSKAEKKKALKSLKIKYNGKEYDEELPFEIPDDDASRAYMTKHLQMSKLSQSKAQESAELEKEVRSFIAELKKNPRKILADPTIGVDIKKLAAEIIEEEITNSQKTPEQLDREKMEQELKALKEEREREKEESRERELTRLQQQEYERYDMLMGKALETAQLPKSPYIVKKMADYMLMGLKEGLDVKPEDVLPIVKEEMMEELKSMFGIMPEDVIESIVGKDVFNKVRKKNVAKLKEAKAAVQPQKLKQEPKAESQEEANRKKDFKSFFGKGI